MTIKKGLLALVLCILTSVVLQAQLAITFSDVTGETGQTVEVDVSVSDFMDITSMQFSLNWDSTVLDFKSIGNLSDVLPAFSDNEIGLMETSSGAIRVAWFDGSTLGVSVPDDTRLFTLTLQIIGEAGTNSNITVSSSPIVIEVTSSDGVVLDSLGVMGGEVTIPGDITSTTFFAAPNGMELHQNEPNPFNTITRIKAILPTAHEVLFFITDVSGKIVYQNKFKSVQGENTIEIRSDLLATSGTYYYTLQDEHYQLSRKLILLP